MKNILLLLFLTIFNFAGIGVGYSDTGSLPVELTNISANINNNSVTVVWSTATEVNCYGFEIERTIQNSKFKIQNWKKIGFVKGAGNSNETRAYTFKDSPMLGKYQYRLKMVDLDGKYKYSKIIEISFEKPVEYSLDQNFPNPFNPATIITYSIPKASFVTLKVYNILGELVKTLVNKNQEAGKYNITFSTTGGALSLPSGVYIYRIQAGDFTQSRKMLLIK